MNTQHAQSLPVAALPAIAMPEKGVRTLQAPIPSAILPETGFVRLPQILAVFPISRSAWWAGVKSGIYPKGVKISPRCTAWDVAAIRKLLASFSREK